MRDAGELTMAQIAEITYMSGRSAIACPRSHVATYQLTSIKRYLSPGTTFL